jgi:hypothetical protein
MGIESKPPRRPEGPKPEVKKPEAPKPEAKKLELPKPEARPVAKRPEVKRLEGKRPDVKRPEAKKPDVKRPEGRPSGKVEGRPELSKAQAGNLKRFEKRAPANAKDNVKVRPMPNNCLAFEATSPGRNGKSRSVYEKQVDSKGKTISLTKTTLDQNGRIINWKDKKKDVVYGPDGKSWPEAKKHFKRAAKQ